MLCSLIELPFLKWSELQDLYVKRKKEPSSFSLLQNYINWRTIEPLMNVKIYTTDDDWQSHGTFMLIDYDMEIPHVYFNTLYKNFDTFDAALDCLRMKSNYFLSTLPKRHFPIVEQFLTQKGYTFDNLKHFGGNWYHLNKEEALKFVISPPMDITLSRLKIQHAEQINNYWPLRGPDTIKYIIKLIYYNDNVGAFDSNGNLVAWCLKTPLGALGNVQVVETHKRLGLGSLLVRYMSKEMALKNEEIMAPVKYENLASRAMFEKIGFKAIDEAFCVEIPNCCDQIII